MLDNENGLPNSDVAVESSSDSQTSSQETNNTSGAGIAASNEPTSDKSQNTPFHEHPRWKEMVEQRNSASKRAEDLEKRYSEIAKRLEDNEKKIQSSLNPPKEDELISEMKKINPKFAERFEKLEAQLKRVEEFDNRFKQLDTQDVQTRVTSTFQKFMSDNKVPTSLQKRYENELRAVAASNPKLSVNDIPQVLGDIHKEYTSFLDTYKRESLQGYVKDKAKDSSVPASVSNGRSVNPGKDMKFSNDPDAARREMRKMALDIVKAGKSQ